MAYKDRRDAGKQLAPELEAYTDQSDTVVLALPRGGVPVAFEVAQQLQLPLDVMVVRKIGVPRQEELAMGAIAPDGEYILNQQLVDSLHLPDKQLRQAITYEWEEVQRRQEAYRQDKPPLNLEDKTVILVDDGLATGASMEIAVRTVQKQKPKRVIVAVPVASQQTCEYFENMVDAVVCLATPRPFHAVGVWYENFSQTTDDEVHELLEWEVQF